MQNVNVNQTNDGWEEESLSVIQEEHAVVILIGSEASDKAQQLIYELKLVGIGVRMASEYSDVGKQTAAASGIRFAICIGADEKLIDQVRLTDILDQQEMIMPMDQAIFVIERMYPPADFT